MSEPKTPDIATNWPHPVPLTEGDELYKLLLVVSRENKRISLELEEIYDDRFLGSATGGELEKIGKLVGVKRKNKESDNKLRKRIRGEFAAQSSDTTYDNFAKVILSILDTNSRNVSIKTPPETASKEVDIEVESTVVDDNPLTRTELTSLLDKSVSADAKVNLVETGTFAFAGDDSSLEGWNEGTWSETVE